MQGDGAHRRGQQGNQPEPFRNVKVLKRKAEDPFQVEGKRTDLNATHGPGLALNLKNKKENGSK